MSDNQKQRYERAVSNRFRGSPILKFLPNWLIHHAFYSDENIRLPYIKVFFDLFEIKPNLMKEMFLIKSHAKKLRSPLIGHVHIPKTGGTYVNSLKDVLPFVNFSHVVIRRDRGDRFCPVGLTPIKKRKLSSFFIFSNVRNPLHFFISYYHHVKGFGKHVNQNHYDYEFAQKGFDFLLQTVMARIDKWPSRKFLYPQLFDQDGNCIVDWINRTECLDADLSELCNRFGVAFTPKDRKRVSPNKKNPAQYYSDNLYTMVSETYSREMEIFGYSGFNLVTPIIETMPLLKERLRYDYLGDKIFVEGKLIR